VKIQTAEFITSVGLGDRPTAWHLPRIAFVGRSNVGKSTLINALARRRVAKAGGAPGTTRLLNIYHIQLARHRGELLLVDLPGYGYTRGSTTATFYFDQLTQDYFQLNGYEPGDKTGDRGPAGVVLLVDARHPGLESDHHALAWLDRLALPVLVAATKVDRLKPSARCAALKNHEAALARDILPISAKLGNGLPAFWKALLELVGF